MNDNIANKISTSNVRAKRGNRRLLYYIISLFYALAYIIITLIGSQGNNLDVKFCCFLLMLSYFHAFYVWVKESNRIISMFSLLLLCCLAFNGGQALLYLFDAEINHSFNIFTRYDEAILIKSLLFQIVCVHFITCGGLAVERRQRAKLCTTSEEKTRTSGNLISNISIDLIMYVLFLVSSMAIIINYIIQLSTRMNLSYQEYAYGDYESIMLSIIRLCFFLTMYYGLFRSKKGFKLYSIIAIDAIVAILFVLVGSRFKIVSILAGVFLIPFAVRKRQFKVTRGKKVILVVAGFLLFSVMRGWTYLRNYQLSSLSWDVIKSYYTGGILQGFIDTLAETGSSMRCLVGTIQFVDDFGIVGDQTILYAVSLAIIPYAFLNFFDLVPGITNLGLWFTRLENASVGLGYSIYAEAYFNYAGFSIAFMFVFGAFFVYLENCMFKLFKSNRSIDIILACSILYVLAEATFLARGNMTLITTPLRWSFYIWVIRLFLTGRRKIRT